MHPRQLLAIALLPILLSLVAPVVAGSGPVQRDHIEVELLAEHRSVAPGDTIRVGLRMLPDPAWHTYWENPGDSGLPTRLRWTLPEGVEASAIAWPYPQALPVAHLLNHGYEGEHLLPVTLSVPADQPVGQDLVVHLQADWLVCEVECIPGSAELQLDIPVTETSARSTSETVSELFAWADQRQPQQVAWPATFNAQGGQLSLLIRETEGIDEDWQLFVANENLVDHASEVFIATANGSSIQIAQPLSPFMTSVPETLRFVLVQAEQGRAVELVAERGALVSVGDESGEAAALGRPGLALILVLALAGGVLLNLMPCVFPVLSIKAMSLVAGAGSDQRAHGLAYTAGVVMSFAALAAVLLILRAGGEAIGWGFQLQSPWFVGILIYVLFAMGLALSGLFEFGTRAMGLGQHLTEKSGLRGSFFTGILACVVASPCTAPFMGTALGVAVFLPWPLAMTVFLVLGLGLALPLLLLSFLPGLAQRLPRPGPWMETFKQAMAFPLYLAVVWLLWVLARQTDANGLAAVLAGMVALTFAL